MTLYDRVQSAVSLIRSRCGLVPSTGIILGSGMGEIANRVRCEVAIDYGDIPEVPCTTVSGHAGRLVLGTLGSTPVALMQGRLHYYEGHALSDLTLPTRVLASLGARTLIQTAAVGGINTDLQTGDIVCVRDHLNLLGNSPLRGPYDERLGPRFPDLSEVYSPWLRSLAAQEARRFAIEWHEGVYAAVPGPNYETPAEVRMLRILGADVVGMSVVPEAIVARQCGLDVLVFAFVTNPAAGLSDRAIVHEDVLSATAKGNQLVGDLIEAVIAQLTG